MLKKIKQIKENKIYKIVSNIIYAILVVLVLLILLIAIVQRASNNNISLAGYRIFNILTGSMVPKYEVGDILISKNVDVKDLKEGDDIVYLGNKGDFSGRIVTHQIIKIENENGEYKFHTKGIANPEEDPVISSSQIYGVVIYKSIVLSIISKIINNIFVFYFIILIPISIIIVKQIRNIIGNRETEEDVKEEKENENKGDKEE